MQQVLLNEALAWVEKGVSCIPVKHGEKYPDGGALWFVGARNANNTGSWEPYKTRLPNRRELLAWFGTTRPRNIGIVTGWSGLTVLDFDNWQVYEQWGEWALETGGLARHVLSSSYQVRTSRGVHVYLWCDARDALHLSGVLDIIGDGGYVCGAGSVHPSGTTYTAIDPEAQPVHVPSARSILPPGILSTECAAAPTRTQTVRAPGAAVAVADDPFVAAAHPTGGRLIETANAKVRIEDLVTGLRETGHNKQGEACAMGLCPLHDDHSPSLSVNLDRQIATCRAGCNRGLPMDAVNLIALRNGWTLTQAARHLVAGGR